MWGMFSKSNHQNHQESMGAGEVLLGLVLLSAALDDGKSNANPGPSTFEENNARIQQEINIWCPPGPIGGR